MAVGVIGDDGGHGGLAAGAGGSGHGDQVGNGPQDPQNAPHLGNGLAGAGDPGAHSLGAIDGRAAAKADETLTAVLQIQLPGGFHVADGGVGAGLVIQRIPQGRTLQRLLQRLQQAGAVEERISDQ